MNNFPPPHKILDSDICFGDNEAEKEGLTVPSGGDFGTGIGCSEKSP